MTETPKDLVEEVDRGRSERTPWLALTGVTIAVGALVVVILAVALIVYFAACPRCGSPDTEEISEFSSTACKAFRRCRSCGEPFEHVKEI